MKRKTLSAVSRLFAAIVMICSIAAGRADLQENPSGPVQSAPSEPPQTAPAEPPTPNPAEPMQAAPAHPAAPGRPESRAQFFHGTVTSVSPSHVTVSRALVGRHPESHTFLIRSRTKVSRALKVKSKVTVRYQHLQEGDVALEIQIHPLVPRPS